VLALLVAGCSADDGSLGAQPPSATGTSPTASGSPSPATSPGTSPGEDFEEYVALGDSFTAAPGVLPAVKGTPCQRSTRNYPRLLAERLGVRLTDVSCVGADTSHLTRPQRLGGRRVRPQLAALRDSTDLVTVGLGGNDLGLFARLVLGCLREESAGSPCDEPGGAAFRADLAEIETRVTGAIDRVQAAAPEAVVVVVGYPQLVPERGVCQLLPMDAARYPVMRAVNAGLSAAVARAATAAGATYVDVLAASEGHDVCSDEPWVNGFATDAPASPFHPFAEEQAAVADLVTAAIGR
jgi:lysophospholipase L1-like esterase